MRRTTRTLAACLTVLALAACEDAPEALSPVPGGMISSASFALVGPPGITNDLGAGPTVGGTNIVADGVGLDDVGSGSISVTVPAGATVQSAFLYWGARGDGVDPSIMEVTVGAVTNSVEGEYIGATELNPGNDAHSLRSDLIAEGFSFGPGLNTVDLVLDPNQGVDGASLVITYDDGADGSVELRDGNDWAFDVDGGVIDGDQTEEQTFTFASAPVDRLATLWIVVGDVQDSRPNLIVITSGGAGDQELENHLGTGGPGRDGAEWDTYAIPITVPAGSTELSAQLFSWDDPSSDLLQASLYWVMGALELPVPPPPPSICDGLTPGYWMNWSNHYSTSQFQELVDWVNDNDYAGGPLSIAQITAILSYGGPNAVQRLKKFYYANLLTLALTDLDGLPNPDTAGLSVDCVSPSFDPTLGEALAAAEAIFANPGGYTNGQINAVKNILDAIANLNN